MTRWGSVTLVASMMLAGAAVTVGGPQAAWAAGCSSAVAGDVNGDGFADIAVGAPWDENGQTNEGIVYVYPGSSSFISNLNSWTESNQVSAATGWSVATAGDVNGDGYADMIVGAAFYDDGEGDEGRAFLLLGSATGLISTAWLAEGNQTSAQFGASVSTAGDVNGDGYDDVIVSAPRFDATFTDEGKAFVYLGGAGGLAASPAWTTLGGVLSAGYGASVSTAGDVNGDGYADVIVGAPQGTTGLGWVSVFLGSAAGLSTNPAWTVQNNQPGAQFGNSVDTAGDVNGDGYADVIIGAPFYDASTTDAGRAVVYLGLASGLAPTPTWTKDGSEFGGRSPAPGTPTATATRTSSWGRPSPSPRTWTSISATTSAYSRRRRSPRPPRAPAPNLTGAFRLPAWATSTATVSPTWPWARPGSTKIRPRTSTGGSTCSTGRPPD